VSTAVTIIDSRPSPAHALREVWAYRELLAFLVWRDLKVRYRQTLLGAGWALLQPIATMVVFAVVFGRLLGVPSEGVPYPSFVLAALVPWTYFSGSVTNGAASLLNNQNLVGKVYFPRLLLPASAVLTTAVDAALALLLAVAFVAWQGAAPGAALALLPLWALLAVLLAFGTTAWLSALTVRYRDVRYTLPFAMQLWLFATPIAYPSSSVPEAWRAVYALNPMVTVVDGFRAALLGTALPTATMVATSVLMTTGIAVIGVAYFRRVERSFADVL
jgi:lipopolysaccharide transport system permease protein